MKTIKPIASRKLMRLICLFVVFFQIGAAQSKSNFQTSGSINFKVKFFIHGYYLPGGKMQPVLYNQGVLKDTNIVDTIEVIVHHHASPYKVLYSIKALLHTNGMSECKLPRIKGKHYISIKARNTLLTCSAQPLKFKQANILYDFTSNANKAYGNNMKKVEEGVWAFYCSDVNQDGRVNDKDIFIIESSIERYRMGYLVEDINGDGVVDMLDRNFYDEYMRVNKNSILTQNPHLHIVTKFPERKLIKLLKDNTFLTMLNTIF